MAMNTQRAEGIGKKGGTVRTTGMTFQEKQRIDAAVNAGRKAAGQKGK